MNTRMDERPVHLSEEVRTIPWWAIVLAIAFFAGMQVLFHLLLVGPEHKPPPLAARIVLGVLAGSVLAFFVLLIGYVNVDAGRRGMSRALWTVIVIFVPNAIGFILYFVLRHPLMMVCPQCATRVNTRFNFCPSCSYALHPTCSRCKSPIRAGDSFCPICGLALAEQQQPQSR
jgi:hypothetical protein